MLALLARHEAWQSSSRSVRWGGQSARTEISEHDEHTGEVLTLQYSRLSTPPSTALACTTRFRQIRFEADEGVEERSLPVGEKGRDMVEGVCTRRLGEAENEKHVWDEKLRGEGGNDETTRLDPGCKSSLRRQEPQRDETDGCG
jgi:hypothetical protein